MPVTKRKTRITRPLPREDPTPLRDEMTSRLLAQAFVREGFSLARAWKVLHPDSKSTRSYPIPDQAAFSAELERLMHASGVNKEEVLSLLWTVLQSSALDFLDESGHVMQISELKKLPRILQACIGDVRVTGKSVRIRLPDKLTALRQLAELMKWVGPAITQNLTIIHVSDHIREADTRARRLGAIYEQTPTVLESGSAPEPAASVGDPLRDETARAADGHADHLLAAHAQRPACSGVELSTRTHADLP